MIYIKRSLPPPAFQEQAKGELEEARRFFQLPESERRQRRFPFQAYKNREAREALLLLGENATGKSTILHAIALTLAGGKYFSNLVQKYGIRPSKYIRYKCKSGTVYNMEELLRVFLV